MFAVWRSGFHEGGAFKVSAGPHFGERHPTIVADQAPTT
jgi:hypothetical protein